MKTRILSFFNTYSQLWLLSLVFTACELNNPPSPSPASLTATGTPAITILDSDPIVIATNQSQFPVQVVCAYPDGIGTIVETNTTFSCTGPNSEALILLDLLQINQGTFTLSVQFTDGTIIISEPILKDTLAPDISQMNVLIGLSTSNLYSSPDINYILATDNGSGILNHQARILLASDNSVVVDWKNIISGSYLSGISLIRNQNYFYQVRAIDNAGNISEIIQTASWQAIGPIIILSQSSNAGVVTAGNQYTYSLSGTCNVIGGFVTSKVTDPPNHQVVANTLCNINQQWSAQMDLSSLTAGTLTVSIEFSDLVSNLATPVASSLLK